MPALHILVLGASYGLLPALRLRLAGHRISVVCRAEERAALTGHGARIRFQRRDGSIGDCLTLPAGDAGFDAVAPDVDLTSVDLVFLAMSEPQYMAPQIAALVRRIAAAKRPVVSLMNALPPPFLRRLTRLDVDALRAAYGAWTLWDAFEPELFTAASPDAQAIRSDPGKPNELTVTLASNFKIAPFATPTHQRLIDQIAADVSAYRPGGRPLPVRLLAQPSLHVPLSKWPMLIAGNCRCLQPDGSIVPIAEAVGADTAASQQLYENVADVVTTLGAPASVIVPYAHYARAARALRRPSSLARALASGAVQVERVDKMVQLAAQSLDIGMPDLDAIVQRIDQRIAQNDAG